MQALIGEHHTSGLSSPHQKTLSINLRELLAVQSGLRALELLLVDLSVALFCDNTTTVTCVRLLPRSSWALPMFQRTLSDAPFGDRVRLDPSPGGSRSTGPQMASGDPSFCALPDREASSVLLPASDSRIAGTDALLKPWDDLLVYAFPPIVVVRKVLVSEVLEELRLNSYRSVLASEGTVIRRSHRTVGSNRSATTDPFPPLPSDLPVPQLTTWLLSSDSPISPASLRQVIHNFPSFERSSDLWIFKLDGIPMRCDIPNRCLIILTLLFRVC